MLWSIWTNQPFPSQQIVYLGIRIDSQTFRVSATPSGIEKFFSIVEEFLSSKVQSAKLWRVLLGHLASLTHLVPNGQLCMQALQQALKRGWDFRDKEVLVPWDIPVQDDLQWWCADGRLKQGISLALRSPDQLFWSDASDQGWRATVDDRCVSGVWLGGEGLLLIDQHELLAVEKGLGAFRPCLVGRVVAVFCDNMTAVAYLRRQSGTLAVALSALAQRILLWAEQQNISLMPQFVQGRNNVVVDALSRPNQVISSEWILHQVVFDWLLSCWPVTIDLFASSLSHCCSVYFAPVSDPMAAGTDTMFWSWDSLQAYAFPPLRHDQSGPVEGAGLPEPVVDSDCSLLATPSVVSRATGAVVGAPSSSSIAVGLPAAAAYPCFVSIRGETPAICESFRLL